MNDCNGLTPLDLAQLAYPFRRADHEFLECYVYIQEEAITERLDRVDPNWSITIDEAIAYGDSVVMRSTLTVKGVSRSNTGGNPVQRDKKNRDTGKYEPQPLYTQADNGVNAHKAAATDALKRCARMFGVGRYLLSAPKEGGAFDNWLAEEHKAAKAKLDALRTVDAETGEISAVKPETPQPSTQPTQNAPTRPAESGNDTVPNASPPSTPSSQQNGGGSPDLLDGILDGSVVIPLNTEGDDKHLPRDVEGLPILGSLDMKALGKRAQDEKLVRGRAHFSNLIDLLWREGEIRAASKPDAVLDAIRKHEAEKDLQREAVGK